jgi:hypothetical protein
MVFSAVAPSNGQLYLTQLKYSKKRRAGQAEKGQNAQTGSDISNAIELWAFSGGITRGLVGDLVKCGF